MPPRDPAFVAHTKALRRLVATAGPGLEPDAVNSVVASRVWHVLQQITAAEAQETAADNVHEELPNDTT